MIKTVLQLGNQFSGFAFNSIIDSGAGDCVFPAEIGEKIGIGSHDGRPVSSIGIGGSEVIRCKRVKVWTLIENHAWHFDCEAGFSKGLNRVGWGILGRTEFFSLFQEVVFDQSKKLLRLKIDGQRPKKKDPGPFKKFFN